jgi:hypothetical protein
MGYLFGQKRRKVGRLQRQAARCFLVTQEADSVELGTWCWPRVVLIEKRPLTECERSSMNRAARSVGARRVRRLGRSPSVGSSGRIPAMAFPPKNFKRRRSPGALPPRSAAAHALGRSHRLVTERGTTVHTMLALVLLPWSLAAAKWQTAGRTGNSSRDANNLARQRCSPDPMVDPSSLISQPPNPRPTARASPSNTGCNSFERTTSGAIVVPLNPPAMQ